MIQATDLNVFIQKTFSHEFDIDYEEGSCVIWGYGFSKWLELAHGLSGIPLIRYSPEDDMIEFPQFCDHCTVFIPALNITVDWRGINAKERWTNQEGIWKKSTWNSVLLDPLDEHYTVFTRLCDNT
jgi:hypothetical protein